MVEQHRAPGVCLIRVQVQAASLLITVVQTPDVSSRHGETTTSFADVDTAIEAVRTFLGGFSAPRLPNGGVRGYEPPSA
jgi:hypothetical protein